MDRIRRNERMTAMMKLLSGTPNRIFTLNSFCELFGTAKSTMSEDVDLLQQVAKAFDLGQVDTVTGAAGGVRYRPSVSREKARLCSEEAAGAWPESPLSIFRCSFRERGRPSPSKKRTVVFPPS